MKDIDAGVWKAIAIMFAEVYTPVWQEGGEGLYTAMWLAARKSSQGARLTPQVIKLHDQFPSGRFTPFKCLLDIGRVIPNLGKIPLNVLKDFNSRNNLDPYEQNREQTSVLLTDWKLQQQQQQQQQQQ